MKSPTDFGAPKKPKKKGESKDSLSVKVKGKPEAVKGVLKKMGGAGDAEGLKLAPPGPRGPRRPYHNPAKPRLVPTPDGAGDAPRMPFRGGSQPSLTIKMLTLHKPTDASKPAKSNNPESGEMAMPGKRPMGGLDKMPPKQAGGPKAAGSLVQLTVRKMKPAVVAKKKKG